MHDANDTLITFAPRSAAVRIALASDNTSPALRCCSCSSCVGWAGENAPEDCLIEINVASGATPTTPSGAPGGGPATSGCAEVGSPCPSAGATSPSGGGGGGGGGRRRCGRCAGAVTVTVDGGGGAGGALVGAGLAGTGAGGGGAPTPAGLRGGRSAGFDGAAPMMLATTVPWLSQSVRPPSRNP